METFSALLSICAGNSPVTGEFPAKGPVTRSNDVFLIRAWINGWVNNGEAGDLRRHGTHYDVIVMVGDYKIERHFINMRTYQQATHTSLFGIITNQAMVEYYDDKASQTTKLFVTIKLTATLSTCIRTNKQHIEVYQSISYQRWLNIMMTNLSMMNQKLCHLVINVCRYIQNVVLIKAGSIFTKR